MDPETRKWFYSTLAVIAILFILFFLRADFSGKKDAQPRDLGREVQAIMHRV